MSSGRSFSREIAWLFRQAAFEWVQDNALRLSAAVSFYAALSLAPLLTILIRVMGIIHAKQFARQFILRQTAGLMGAQAAAAIEPILDSSLTHSTGNLAAVVSSVILLFSTTGVFIELQSSLNTIWGVKFKSRWTNPAGQALHVFVRGRLISLIMVFILGFLLILSFFVSGLFTTARQHLFGVVGWPAFLVQLTASLAVEFIFFSAIFRFLPALRPRWPNVWPGALIAAFLFSAGRFGLSVYFRHSRIDNAYGAVGSLMAVLTWIYYSSFSLFFGAEFTKVWTRRNNPPPAKAPR